MTALMKFLDTDRFAGKRLDLVILGDIIDLWQTMPDSDLIASDSSQINLTLDIVLYEQDLGLIAEAEHRLVIVAGNFDHAFVQNTFQAFFKDLRVNRFQFLDRGDNFFFPEYHFYSAPELGVYMEHGNQYDKSNKYRDFSHFGSDPRQNEYRG